ncbi:MAG: hypothetical protein ACRD15_09495 [Vicinamibacterales bacterium]
MMAGQQYFHSATADRLMEEENYPREIAEFLDGERGLLTELVSSVDLLIEAACNDGRYLTFAAQHGVRYLGVDLVPRHVEAGHRRIAEYQLPNDRYGFTVGDISELAEVLNPAVISVPRERCAVLFPFSIFSAIPDPAGVARTLRALNLPFVATVYAPSAEATEVRRDYYRRCGYEGIVTSRTEEGVWLRTDGGLSTVAFHPDVLKELWSTSGLEMIPVELSMMGTAWVSTTLVRGAGEGSFLRSRNPATSG